MRQASRFHILNDMTRRTKVENPRYPHTIKIVRRELPGRYESGPLIEKTVYEGKGRSYTDTTTTGDNNVQENKRKASIPVRYDEWGELTPKSGDILIAKKDWEPDNNRTVIYGELNRNSNEG